MEGMPPTINRSDSRDRFQLGVWGHVRGRNCSGANFNYSSNVDWLPNEIKSHWVNKDYSAILRK